MKFVRFALLICLLSGVGLLAACRAAPTTMGLPTSPAASLEASPGATAAAPATQAAPTLAPSPTWTPEPERAAAFFAPGPGSAFAQTALSEWQAASAASGLLWEQRPSLSAADLAPSLKLALVFAGALAPGADLAQLAAAAPQTQFVAFGFSGLAPAPNLTVAGALPPDQQGFLAGAIAALLTPDWRVGVIAIADTPEDRAQRSGFLHGAAYECGLCISPTGPIVDYPVYVELPAAASSAEWQAAAQELLNKSVKTIYLPPGVADAGLLDLLSGSGAALIAGAPLPAGSPLATILPGEKPLLDLAPQILAGQSGGQVALQWQLTASGAAFSPGRQRLANQLLADLQGGFIDTGVDPQTGENR